MKHKLIMLVDDDNDIRTSIADVLALEGYTVVQAENGQVALDKLKFLSSQSLPGLIILDLMMPVMDGIQFLHIIQVNHPDDFAKIPIVVASAKASFINSDNMPLVVKRIKKPFNLDEFLTIVEELCGHP